MCSSLYTGQDHRTGCEVGSVERVMDGSRRVYLRQAAAGCLAAASVESKHQGDLVKRRGDTFWRAFSTAGIAMGWLGKGLAAGDAVLPGSGGPW